MNGRMGQRQKRLTELEGWGSGGGNWMDEWDSGRGGTESTPGSVATLQMCVSNRLLGVPPAAGCVGAEAAKEARRITAPRLILSVT